MEPSPAAALVLDFANTVDIEDATDVLATGEGTASWLRERGLSDDADVGELLILRAGLRARLLIANGGAADEDAIAAAEALLSRVPVTVRLGGGFEPEAPLGAPGAVGALAAAWALTVACGDWARLKQCPDHECGWVFWDATRSRTRRWCTMRVCGNRAKVRAYAARKG